MISIEVVNRNGEIIYRSTDGVPMYFCHTDGRPIEGEVYTYTVDGVTYLACSACAIKGDEIAYGEEFHQRSEINGETTNTLIAVQRTT